MRKLIVAVFGAALMFAPAIATAQGRHNPDDRRGQHQDPRHGHSQGADRGHGGNYGQWNARWGARPPAPPRHWTRRGDWYRHVRACQLRFRSYNPRTDTYVVRRGVTRRCPL
jgi:hypothetical protein